MHKVWPYVLGAVLVASAAVVAVLAVRSIRDNDSSNQLNAGQNQPPAAKQACAIFTLADAKAALGDNVKGGTNPKTTSSHDLLVTTCTYTQDTGSNAPTTPAKTASLLVRAPKTTAAAASNRNQFGSLRPSGAQTVKGYGSGAYWDAQMGQFDILKNNTWYVITNGPPVPADRTIDQAEQLADLLISQM